MAANPKVKRLRHLLAQAKKIRKAKYDERWDEALEWLKGNQEIRSGDTDPDFRSDTVTNFLFAQIMTIIPVLANRTPQVAITPLTEQAKPKADKLMELIDRIFRHNDFIIRQNEMIMNCLLFGRGLYKPIWSGSMRGGLGDVKITVPDTRSIYKDKFWIPDSNWIFECRQIDKLTLYQMYPDKHDAIDRVFRTEGEEKKPESVETGNTGEIGYHAAAPGETALTTTEAYIWDTSADTGKASNTIEIVEAWFIDESTYEDFETLTDPKTGKTKKSRVKKVNKKSFPTGHLITFAGEEILDDRPNPFPAFPYVECENYFIPGENYGQGELEQLKPLQEQYNIRSNQIFDGLNFSTFPMMFYDHTSGLEPGEIINKPGGIYPVDDIKGITRFDPTGISAGVFQSLPMIRDTIDMVSGIHDVNKGMVPGDVRSGFAIEQLQETAQSRLRLKTRNMEYAAKNLSRYITRMIGLFYIPGVHYGEEVDLRGIDPDLFDFEIKAGVNLPGSRIAQQQLYQWMYTNQIVDEQFIVEQSDIPNKDELIKRVQEMWQAKKAAMLSQGQPPAGQV
jgi:hypothetical protein